MLQPPKQRWVISSRRITSQIVVARVRLDATPDLVDGLRRALESWAKPVPS